MTQMRRALFATALLVGLATTRVASADVALIEPTVNIDLPTINFDQNINPGLGSLSEDALNIIRAHRVALQQVKAAIQFLRVHRDDILAGENQWYNQNFGDFYDPNSPFAGLYNRILKHDTGKLDQFNQPIYEDWYNTAHYDRVLFVFQRIEEALTSTINYAWGAQTGNAANAAIFDAYRNGTVTIGDTAFGSPTQPDNVTPIPIDPTTGLPLVDPVTMLPVTNPPLLGEPLVAHFAITLLPPFDRGLVQWGLSTSFSKGHLDQIANNPNNPLPWDEDNAISTQNNPLNPEDELAFFKDRLDAFGVVDATTGEVTVYVGGAFLNEEQRADSGGSGEPNQFFTETEFNQYQMIIEALAQAAGSTDGTGTGTGNTTATAIENGIFELLGANANFYQALDGKSYASFVDLFKPIEEGGIGDGSLLPPPGKAGGRSDVFVPLVPAS